MRTALSIAAATLCVCGQLALFVPAAGAADAAAGGGGASVSAADRRKLVAETGYEVDASGKVENACGEKVTPRIVPAEVGGAVGTAEIVVIPNGPKTADCYEGGPGDLYLMRRTAKGFHIVFADVGRIVVLPSAGTEGVHDIALTHTGGGASPVFRWGGSGGYVAGGRNAKASELQGAARLP